MNAEWIKNQIGNDFIPSSFHRWSDDNTDSIIIFGFEYKPESKIIATRAVKLLNREMKYWSVNAGRVNFMYYDAFLEKINYTYILNHLSKSN